MLRCLGGYALVGFLVTVSAWTGGRLLGHGDVDVWNHAWGYWWWFESLSSGTLPWRTQLASAPAGGVLWFIDPLGALMALVPTLLAGPAFAWNFVQAARVAGAGLAAHLFSRELSGPGAHNAAAGVAFASTPFLWCELENGISEVSAVGWVPLALWAAARAFRLGHWRAYALLGAVAGLSAVATFYYGLLVGFLVGAWWLGRLARGRVDVGGSALALVIAAAIAAPSFLLMQASVAAPDAMIVRDAGLNDLLLRHNAVDPREYIMPGKFQSVDFAAVYGQAFHHTGYLRWSVIGLGLVGLARARRAGAMLWALALFSLVLGAGPFLYYNGDLVRVSGNRLVMMPFGILQSVVPDLAVTHPLRFAVGAHAAAAALVGLALARQPGWASLLAGAAVVAETALASNATWPIPTAPATIDACYTQIAASDDPRAVLDLPSETGRTMASSRFFWYQVVHRHPVPWRPDVNGVNNGDPEGIHLFQRVHDPRDLRAEPRLPALDATALAHLRARYGWIVVHLDLERRHLAELAGGKDRRTSAPADTSPLSAQLEAALGPPSCEGENLRVFEVGAAR